jgi:hypothetical protein
VFTLPPPPSLVSIARSPMRGGATAAAMLVVCVASSGKTAAASGINFSSWPSPPPPPPPRSSSSSPSSSSPSSAIVQVGGLRYRVQALSERVLRLEAEGPRGGFEDRPTFFARNRSWGGGGIPVHAKESGPNRTVLSTSAWVLELTAAVSQPSAGPNHDAAAQVARAHAAAAARGRSSSTCTDPLHGFTLSGVPTLAGTPASAAAQDAGMCCAACDRASGCVSWSWTPPSPPSPTPSPTPSPAPSSAGLRPAPCNASRLGQLWSLVGGGQQQQQRQRQQSSDGSSSSSSGWASLRSLVPGSGCIEIHACSRADGAKVDVGFGCKPVPKPGFHGDCAANMAWVYNPNRTFTSVMDGRCLTLSADGKSLSVSACKPSGDAWAATQQWAAFSPDAADDHRAGDDIGASTTAASTVRSLAHTSGAGICIDDGSAGETAPLRGAAVSVAAVSDNTPPPLLAAADTHDHAPSAQAGRQQGPGGGGGGGGGDACVLFGAGAGGTLKGAGKTVVGGSHPGGSYSKGRGCAAKLTAATGAATEGAAAAAPLWSSPSFGSTSSALAGPAPSEVSQGKRGVSISGRPVLAEISLRHACSCHAIEDGNAPGQGTVLAITDAPRIVPPSWGGTPPPTAADAASAQYVQYHLPEPLLRRRRGHHPHRISLHITPCDATMDRLSVPCTYDMILPHLSIFGGGEGLFNVHVS